VEIDAVVHGDRQAEALIERLSRRLAAPHLRGLVDQLLAAERERFAGVGPRWRPLAASTVARDVRGHRDPRPLVLTGTLMRSLTVRGAPHQIVRLTPSSLSFGTGLFYARFHQRGKGVPRRTVVGLTRVQRQSVVAELRRLLLEDTDG
jgi:phage gpG-like protein